MATLARPKNKAHIHKKKSEVAQSCPTLCNPMDCSSPGSSIHGIFQVRVLEWVAIFFSRGSSRPRDRTQIRIIGRYFTIWGTREENQNRSSNELGGRKEQEAGEAVFPSPQVLGANSVKPNFQNEPNELGWPKGSFWFFHKV